MAKISIVGTKARDKALKGAEYVANAVRQTIGPFGLNCLLEKGNKITNDGFSISAELTATIPDEFERRGAIILHEVSTRTNESVGDATSTSEVLAYEIAKEATRYLASDKSLVAKKTPAQVLEMIEKSKDKVLSLLEMKAITTKEELIQSALVSVENQELAQLLGETQWDLGHEGIIIAEEVNDTKCSIEKVKGIRLDNGFGTSLVMNNPEKGSLELFDMPIMLTNYTIGVEEMKLIKERLFADMAAFKKYGLILVARAYTSDAIKMCMETLQTSFPVFPINAPYQDQVEIMKDLEAVTGARFIGTEESNLGDVHIGDIGHAQRFLARSYDGVVTGVDDALATERTLKRVATLEKKFAGEQSEFHKKELEERMGQLSKGFAILKVGSESKTNRKRLKDKADDAVQSVRMALKGGTVRGAGLALKEAAEQLEDGDILKRPLMTINAQIMASAPSDFVVEDWVRDPYLTIKAALENACATAGVLATVNTIICEENPIRCHCNNKQYNEE